MNFIIIMPIKLPLADAKIFFEMTKSIRAFAAAAASSIMSLTENQERVINFLIRIIVPVGSVFSAFLVGYVLMVFIGVLMKPVMIPVWKTPGRY